MEERTSRLEPRKEKTILDLTSAAKGNKRLIKANNKASKKLVMGPTTATLNEPHFWSLKLYGLTGTGLAQPKIGPWPKVTKRRRRGKRTEPNQSKCFSGFNVNRPAYFAVGSPRE